MKPPKGLSDTRGSTQSLSGLNPLGELNQLNRTKPKVFRRGSFSYSPPKKKELSMASLALKILTHARLAYKFKDNLKIMTLYIFGHYLSALVFFLTFYSICICSHVRFLATPIKEFCKEVTFHQCVVFGLYALSPLFITHHYFELHTSRSVQL